MKKNIAVCFLFFCLGGEAGRSNRTFIQDPGYTATYYGKTGGEIFANVAASGSGLSATNLSLTSSEVVEIVSFDLTVIISGNGLTESSGNSSFSDKQKALLRKVKPGSKIIFTDIKAKLSNGKVVKLKKLTFNVK